MDLPRSAPASSTAWESAAPAPSGPGPRPKAPGAPAPDLLPLRGGVETTILGPKCVLRNSEICASSAALAFAPLLTIVFTTAVHWSRVRPLPIMMSEPWHVEPQTFRVTSLPAPSGNGGPDLPPGAGV